MVYVAPIDQRRDPRSDVSIPATRRSRVDLPQPEAPTITSISPSAKCQIDAVQYVDQAEALAQPVEFQGRHGRQTAIAA